MDSDKRVVLITGAAGALGKATAEAFRAVGAQLALLDISEEKLRAAFGPDSDGHQLLAADLQTPESLRAVAGRAIERFGRVDVICNIAGGFRMGHPVHDTPPEIWRHLLDLNAGSVMATASVLVPHMLAAGRGAIVNVAAMAALKGAANMAAYSVSKSAVIRLTESMAAELGPGGVRVNCVLPSTMDTPANRADMPDVDPAAWVSPSAVADVIVFLASDAARAVHGAAIPVEGKVLRR